MTSPTRLPTEDKGPAMVISMSVLTAVATVFVAARLFARARLLGRMHWDDYLITVSLLFGWVYTAMTIVGVQHGDGKHQAVLDDSQQAAVHFWTILGFAPAIMSFGFPKLAVVALLTRLLNPGPRHWRFLWAMAAMTQLNLVINMVLLYTQCIPTASMWDSRITDKHCRNDQPLVAYALYAACFSAAVDFYLAIYPASVLFHLQMPTRKKLGLSVALGFGSIATIVAIYKCTRLSYLTSPDFSYDTADLVIWTSIESNTLVIASCIPIMQPLLDLCVNKRTRTPTPLARASPYSHRHYDNEMAPAPGSHYHRRLRSSSDVSFHSLEVGKGVARRDLDSSPVERDKNPRPESMAGFEPDVLRRPEDIVLANIATVSYDERRPRSSASTRSYPANWRPRAS